MKRIWKCMLLSLMLVMCVSLVSPIATEAKCNCSRCVAARKKAAKKKKCKHKTYKITYKLNGGKLAKSSPKKVIKGKKVTLKTPTRSGYEFRGWYYKKCPHVTKKVTKLKMTKNYTVYAKWKKIPPTPVYTITYRGASASGNPTRVTSGNTVTLKAPIDTKRGYSFGGWLVNGQLTSSFKVTGNTVVEAKWNIVTYKITLKSAEGTKTFKYNINTEVTLPNEKSYNGRKFAGYYTKPNGEGNYIKKIFKGSTGSTTLYAHYVNVGDEEIQSKINVVEVYATCSACGSRSSETFYRAVEGGNYYTKQGRLILQSDVERVLRENFSCSCGYDAIELKTGDTLIELEVSDF